MSDPWSKASVANLYYYLPTLQISILLNFLSRSLRRSLSVTTIFPKPKRLRSLRTWFLKQPLTRSLRTSPKIILDIVWFTCDQFISIGLWSVIRMSNQYWSKYGYTYVSGCDEVCQGWGSRIQCTIREIVLDNLQLLYSETGDHDPHLSTYIMINTYSYSLLIPLRSWRSRNYSILHVPAYQSLQWIWLTFYIFHFFLFLFFCLNVSIRVNASASLILNLFASRGAWSWGSFATHMTWNCQNSGTSGWECERAGGATREMFVMTGKFDVAN